MSTPTPGAPPVPLPGPPPEYAGQTARSRRTRVILIGSAVVAALVTALLVTARPWAAHSVSGTGHRAEPASTTSSTSPTASPAAAASATLASAPVTTADGGSVTLPDGTTVTVPAGSVATDTTLTVTRQGTPPNTTGSAGGPSAGLQPAGAPVHIELGTGTLTGPATLAVPAHRPAAWPKDAPFTPFLAYYDDTDGTWVAENSTYDAGTGLLTATVTHFSWWNPFTWNYGAIRDSIKQAITDMAGVPSGVKPTCTHPAPGSAVHVTGTGSHLIDYCLDNDNGHLTFRARAVPDFPLLLSWSGTATLARRSEFSLDISSAFRWLATQHGVEPADSVVLPTGGDADLTVAPDGNGPVLVHVDYDPQMQLVGIVDATVRVILAIRSALHIDTTAEKAASIIVDSGCFVQNIDDLAKAPAGAFTKLTLDCLKDALTALTKGAGGLLRVTGAIVGVIGTLLGVVGYALNQVVSLFYAGKALVTGQDSQDLTLDAASTDSPPGSSPPPSGASSVWPVHDNEGEPALYAWFGASFEVPDWVSCGAAGDWCIAGIQDEVHIMHVHDIYDAGSVPLAVKDPVAALVAKGLSRTIAQQLVKPGPA